MRHNCKVVLLSAGPVWDLRLTYNRDRDNGWSRMLSLVNTNSDDDDDDDA